MFGEYCLDGPGRIRSKSVTAEKIPRVRYDLKVFIPDFFSDRVRHRFDSFLTSHIRHFLNKCFQYGDPDRDLFSSASFASDLLILIRQLLLLTSSGYQSCFSPDRPGRHTPVPDQGEGP